MELPEHGGNSVPMREGGSVPPHCRAWRQTIEQCRSTAHAVDPQSCHAAISSSACAAHFEFHAVGVAEEQRPLAAEPLDLADLGARRHQPVAHALECLQRVDRDGVVIDRAAARPVGAGRR